MVANTNSQEFGTTCRGHTRVKHVTSTQITKEADWMVSESSVQKRIV